MKTLLLALIIWVVHAPIAAGQERDTPMVLKAQRVFDGIDLHTDAAVLIAHGKVEAIGDPRQWVRKGVRVIDLGDATILPGFIELHAHITLHRISHETLLQHGITTVRDVGGPLLEPSGGDGQLRLLTAGPIITVPGGYPVHGQHGKHGHDDVAAMVDTPEQARKQMDHLIAGGAAVIKVALEPGGEPGAPWTTGHAPGIDPPWPMPTLAMVKAVVEEAHKNGKRVTAHVAESQGVTIALEAGVDEWAHAPCMEISDELLQRAVRQGVKIVTTLDTLSHCPGIQRNIQKLAAFDAEFLYGAEIAHTDVPWGIDAQELHLIAQLTGMSPLELFRTATAKAGDYLGLAPLGRLTPGAPADIIAVKGNPLENFKLLEYPDLVMSGGRLVRWSEKP